MLEQAIVSYGGMATVEALRASRRGRARERASVPQPKGLRRRRRALHGTRHGSSCLPSTLRASHCQPGTATRTRCTRDLPASEAWSETSQETRSLSPRRRSGFPQCSPLPSKPVAHVAQANTRTIIARSDSNGEDLEGFAAPDSTTRSSWTNPSQAMAYADDR